MGRDEEKTSHGLRASYKETYRTIEGGRYIWRLYPLGLGHPEALKGKNKGKYSVRVNGNVRMILEPVRIGERIELSVEIVVEGVVDYHGGKDNWFIS